MSITSRLFPSGAKALICALTVVGMSACTRILAPMDAGSAHLVQQPAASSAALIRVATCWEGLPLAQALAEAYAADNPDVSFDLVPSSTAVAQDLVQAGQADVAVLCHSLGPGDEASALPQPTLALDALVVVVHRDAPIQEIALSDLAALYAGYRLDWAQLGGVEGQPTLVTREGDSVARLLFAEVVMGQEPISTAAIVMPHDRAVLEYVSAHPLAVGHLARSHVDKGVHVLSLEGAFPTEEAIREGSYPLRLALTTERARGGSGHANRFLSFAMGARGREIVSQRYIVPR
ncbi:MAG: substrate-binding domain-containing protein [Anaerolineae bacterium]|nr:substrate-binding domain-containing protein [Anaerolineae bacterium]